MDSVSLQSLGRLRRSLLSEATWRFEVKVRSLVFFFTAMLAILFAFLGIAQVNADFKSQEEGLAAAARILTMVDEPLDDTDPFSDEGLKPG